MTFQLGVGGVSKFKKFLGHLSTSTYHLASDEMLDSRWAKQTPHRAEKLSYAIRALAY
jgi:lysozyme